MINKIHKISKVIKPTKMSISKVKYFIENYLDASGCSDIIDRYSLPKEPVELAYTSGDGIFRNDATLGKKYKFFRFSCTLDLRKKRSRAWKKLTEEEEIILREIHSKLEFPTKGNTVHYIKFFGLADECIVDKGINPEIKKLIIKQPCVSCGTKKDIECDHKNDLYLINDARVRNKDTQTIDDFQPLCKHCNDIKRAAKEKMLKENKRYSAINLHFPIGFTSGDETLDLDDPYWYVGTYWGDVKAFKQKLYLRLTPTVVEHSEEETKPKKKRVIKKKLVLKKKEQ